MRLRLLPFLFLAISVVPVGAQEPVAAYAGDQPVIALYVRIASWAARLSPMLAQVRTVEWVSKGASETYTQQATSAAIQLRAVQQDMADMQKRSDAMQDGMKALFRIQAFHRTLESLLGGLRRYQNPALADLVLAVASEDAPDLQKLEQYLLELAAQRDNEYKVVEREAQRCRGVLSKEPAAVPAARRKPAQ